MPHLRRVVAIAFGLCAAAACGDDFDDLAADMEGIYQVRTHTENLDACEPGGDSLTGADVDGLVVAKSLPIFGTPNVGLISCADPADCRDKIARHQQQEPYAVDFAFAVQKVVDGALAGTGISTGFNMDGTCKEGSVFTTTASVDGDVLTIVQRRIIADDYTASGDGSCTTDAAQNAAAGNECSQLEELVADLAEAL